MDHFAVNPALLDKAQARLADRPGVYWVIGGACAGKSTLCRILSDGYEIPVYDLDAHIFGDYRERCRAERHPAMCAWFSAPDPFAWMLGLSPEAFESFNRAVTAEYLDLLADDLAGLAPGDRVLLDGGITHPSLVVRAIPAERIACLQVTESLSAREWDEAPERRYMKEMVLNLPGPDAAWRKFLLFDALIARTLSRECAESGIRIFPRDERTAIDTQAELVARHFGFTRRRADAEPTT